LFAGELPENLAQLTGFVKNPNNLTGLAPYVSFTASAVWPDLRASLEIAGKVPKMRPGMLSGMTCPRRTQEP